MISAMKFLVILGTVTANAVAQLSQISSEAVSKTNASAFLESAATVGGYQYGKLKYRSDYYIPYNTGYSSGYGSKEHEYGYNAYATQSCYGQTPGFFGNVAQDCKSFTICQHDGDVMRYCDKSGNGSATRCRHRNFSNPNAMKGCEMFKKRRLDVMDCPTYLKFNNYLAVCDWPYKVDASCNPLYKEEYSSSSYGKTPYPSSYAPEGKVYENPSLYYGKPSYYPTSKGYTGYSNQYEYPSSYGTKNQYPSYGYSQLAYSKQY